MKHKYVIFALLLLSGGGLLTAPAEGRAAESASFQLTDDPSGFMKNTGRTSTNFQLNDDGLSWISLPVVSTHFQIVTASPDTSSASSLSSSVSSVSSVSSPSSSAAPSGGGRGGGTNRARPVSLHGATPVLSVPGKIIKPAVSPPPAPGIPQRGTRPSAPATLSPARNYHQIPQQMFRPSAASPIAPLKKPIGNFRQKLLSPLGASLFGTSGTRAVLTWTDIHILLLGFLLILLAMLLHQQKRKQRRLKPKKRQSHSKRRK